MARSRKKVWMTQGRAVASSVLALTLMAASLNARATGYALRYLGTLGGSAAHGRSINEAGQIAGASSVANGTVSAVRWDCTLPTPLDSFGGTSGVGFGINESGQVAGLSFTPDGLYHAAIWNGTSITALAAPSGKSVAYGINDAGQVAGDVSKTVAGATGTEAVRWDGGVPTALTPSAWEGSTARAINASGQIAGAVFNFTAANGGYSQAARWDGTAVTYLDSLGDQPTGSAGFGINDAGQVVGYAADIDRVNGYAVRWDGTALTVLAGLDGAEASFAYAINNNGDAVGNTDWQGRTHATLWTGQTAIDLNDAFDESVRGAGWTLNVAFGINDRGWITGIASNELTYETRAFLLSPVPEPQGWAMWLAGLGLLGVAMRRRAPN